ncbi:GNAT family N-acetyltransferase [Actinomadura sp. ATCC 31491]|uniref:GNAT family N-acetyltransferase n=1 Tax=Actinomadura luzonensis TaxID=2805427 RepID=A0ABT0G9G6_9ACTN|nr:GNAT family N-acetyltransferase [Actinomadura luzonensis]MCK2221242.1 GNAT family N-acetyltransferase [Actinomadura luzonensis]
MDAVIRAHAARVRAADPLVAGQDELRGKDRLETRDAVGLATVERIDPGSMRASWSPLVVHRLQARVAGPSPEAALGALLDRWLAGLRLDEPGQALTVTWPSRDVAPLRALAARNFAPVVAQAVRAGIAGTSQGAGVRRVTPDDLETLARLYERLIAYDAHFGWVAVRASTASRLRAFLASEVMPTEWCWLAEDADGTPLGCVLVQPPAHCGWIASSVDASPLAYLSVLYVDPAARGRGVGALLADVAHGYAAAQGVRVMLLHHALPNPLSTPFWSRRGYRPLFTQWVRHLGARF